MVPFEEFWIRLTGALSSRTTIINWSRAGRTRTGSFDARYCGGNVIKVITQGGSERNVPKKDFKMIYERWEGYVGGSVQRSELNDSHSSTYVISIIRQHSPEI